MRPNVPTRLLCIVLIANLVASLPAYGEQDSATSGNSSAPPPPAASASGSGSTFTGPLSDYVPCIFSEDDQFAMRAQSPVQKPLDRLTAEQLLNAAKVAIEPEIANYSQEHPQFVETFWNEYSPDPESIRGRTSDQAILIIQSKIYEAVTSAVTTAVAKGSLAGQPRTDLEVQDAKMDAANRIASAVKAPPKGGQSPPDFVALGREAITQSVGLDPNYKSQVLRGYNSRVNGLNAEGFRPGEEDVKAIIRQAAKDPSDYPFVEDRLTARDAMSSLRAALVSVAGQAVKRTQAEAKQFQPPNDVSCSMAVMSWKETRDIFGRRVANTFIAIQVTLRNLNTKNEFLVHDIQVAVDTGMSQDYFGRFQAGRDKLLVRAVAQRGQSDDRRNVVLNTLQTVGAIAGASSLVGGTVEFKDAVAVFQGAFLTGFTNIFPDHTVEQLNHINDLVFSASNTSKVVVPVQGSVPLVTFISEKPIEQLPFAWCGRLPHKGFNPEQWFAWGADRNCNFNGGKNNPGYVTPYRYSKKGEQQPTTNQQSAINGYPVGPSVAQKDRDGNALPIEDGLPPWDDLEYKDWRGAAVRMLQEHTFVVVGGVHIQEVVTQPKVANLSCPQLTSSKVDLSQTDSGKVSCTISGSGLSLITAINLQKDNDKKAGSIKPNTDGNTATLTFDPKEICSAEGDYSLFVTYKSDTQKDATPLDTGNKVSLAKQPAIDGTPTISGTTLTWNGKCMDQIRKVVLAKDGDDKNSQTFDVTGTPSDKQTTATVTTTKDASYQVGYKIDAQSGPVWPKPTITVKGP